eukprot:Gb_17446 [translate_table: standard]
MYADFDLLFPHSQNSVPDINDVEGFRQLDKEVLNRGFVESFGMTDLDFESGDLFKAPIFADLSYDASGQDEVMGTSVESEQNICEGTEKEIAHLQITLLNDSLLYACDGFQDLVSSSIIDFCASSPPVVTPPNNPENSLQSCSDEMTNTVEKVVSISQSCGVPAEKRSNSSIDHSELVSKENIEFRDSCFPIPAYMQSPTKMQRSFSSHTLGQLSAIHPINPTSFYPHFSPMHYSSMQGRPSFQLPDFQGLNMRPPLASMRRVYSTGDIKMGHGLTSSLEPKCSTFEETEFKIGNYTLEERKQCIHRYRKKRTKRNFNKKIKYACRKSLAENQPRVRGRFASKNDDVGLSTAKANGHLEEDQEEVVNTTQEDEDELLIGGYPTDPIDGITGMVPMNAEHSPLVKLILRTAKKYTIPGTLLSLLILDTNREGRVDAFLRVKLAEESEVSLY